MEPMYLHDVEEQSSAQGVYADILRAMSASGMPISQIWHLFGFKPDATDHLSRFTEAVMRGPSPLSAGMRELIAAYTSASNQCPFCRNSHAAVAPELLENEALVNAVIENLEAAPLPEPEKALLRFVRKITLSSAKSASLTSMSFTARDGTTKRSTTRSRSARCSISTTAG